MRKYGVWVDRDRRGTAANALYQTLMEEDPAPWTVTEIQECLDAGEVFDSRRIDNVLNKHNAGKTTAPAPSMPTPRARRPTVHARLGSTITGEACRAPMAPPRRRLDGYQHPPPLPSHGIQTHRRPLSIKCEFDVEDRVPQFPALECLVLVREFCKVF